MGKSNGTAGSDSGTNRAGGIDGVDNGNGHIRTYLRVRPSKDPSGFIKIDEFDRTKLTFHVLPVEHREGEYVNNTRTTHHFKFDGVLGETSTQQDVFSKVGKGAIGNVLDGYNSTVFAYGQTGSGKTFTVTGGAERYVDRGLIPRALSLLFAEFKKRSDQQFNCYISYLEIYNEQGFDLLDPSHESNKLEDLPRVSLKEDEGGNIHLRNLSVHLAANEEEALNYLFLGDTNRAISETAMNKASSRSHCIFTCESKDLRTLKRGLHPRGGILVERPTTMATPFPFPTSGQTFTQISIEGRKPGSERVMRSKLHLVDLAGSERVHKTQTGGQTLVEAKHINVSLFFLEMVIVALHERGTKGRQHIPYRNSMMTSVLRDSLGGNCKTVMIATINAEAAQTDESISTCRFAQRVSMIKNDARVNEELDQGVLIHKLRSNCAALSDEIAFLKGETGEGDELTSEEINDLKHRCRIYVEDPAPGAELNIGAYTLTKLKRCFAVFKEMIIGLGKPSSGDQAKAPGDERHVVDEREASRTLGCRDGAHGEGADEGEVTALRDALRQRDSEIAILVNMLKQGKCHACALNASTVSRSPGNGEYKAGAHAVGTASDTPSSRRELAHDANHYQKGRTDGNNGTRGDSGISQERGLDDGSSRIRASEAIEPAKRIAPAFGGPGERGSSTKLIVPRPAKSCVLEDPQTAFGYFRDRHPGRAAMEENKALLSEKYTRAKAMGGRVNQTRSTIQYLKSTIEQIRRERALDGMMERPSDREQAGSGHGDGGAEGVEETPAAEEEEDEEEAKCKRAIEVEKRVYRDSFQELRQLKSEIEQIQRLLEKARLKLQTDFETWYGHLMDDVNDVEGCPGTSTTAENREEEGRPTFHRLPGRTPKSSWVGTAGAKSSKGEGPDASAWRPHAPMDAWGTPPASAGSKGVLESNPVGGIGDGCNVRNVVEGDRVAKEETHGCCLHAGQASGDGAASTAAAFPPPTTGDKGTDDDIAAFYRAKEELERRRKNAAAHLADAKPRGGGR